MHFQSMYRTICVLLTLLVPTWTQGQSGALPPPPTISPYLKVPFDADVEGFNGTTKFKAHLLISGDRFRAECTIFSPQGQKMYDAFQTYDATTPHVVWQYDPMTKIAHAESQSGTNALYEAIRRDGDPATRRRLGIGLAEQIQIGWQPYRPDPYIRMRSGLMNRNSPSKTYFVPVNESRGYAVICGYRCQLYELMDKSPDKDNGIDRLESAWVEPKTGLVLRWEQRVKYGLHSAMPPSRVWTTVTHLHFLQVAPPIRRFQIPPGATVKVLKVFVGAKLPGDVRREIMTGPGSGMGRVFLSSTPPMGMGGSSIAVEGRRVKR